MRIGSLFAGIGGLELGLEMAGVGRTAWQVEIDPFCRRVLAKHWPNATRYEDVKTVGSANLAGVDLVCGGFPCQDVSSAGKREGLSGAKSGLWYEYLRVVGELRPRYVVVENVASGTKLWVPTVRGGLEGLGYRVRAFALSAADVGAPHLRRRVFVIAYSNGTKLREQPGGLGGAYGQSPVLSQHACGNRGTDGNADRERQSDYPEHGEVAGVRRLASGASAWAAPPVFRGVDDGSSARLDRRRRLKALGNAVVPQCAEAIGRLLIFLDREGAF